MTCTLTGSVHGNQRLLYIAKCNSIRSSAESARLPNSRQQRMRYLCLCSSDPTSLHCKSEHSQGGLLRTAGVIGAATAISKVLGLLRELVLAAVFGVGTVVDAFGYAFILPGFFLAVLGGINGPIHVTVATSLSKLSEEQGLELVLKLSFSILLAALFVSTLVLVFAGCLVDTFAPGLGSLTRRMAILQLRIMTPCITLACFMGISHGRLSASGKHGIASLSPAISSIAIIIFAALYAVLPSRGDVVTGAIFLATATTVGAIVQCLVQIDAQGQQSTESFVWENIFQHKDVKEFFFLMIPAAVSSGMLQFATYTDLYFASFLPQAAAALGYANLLVMAPLGIISSSVLIPLLPVFARLSEPAKLPELRTRVRQGLQLCMALTSLMTALFVPLAKPIVRILFQRYAFDASAAESVASLVVYYATGSTFYLARDFLVRVFISLGDSQAPFFISTVAIVANAALDWLFVHKAGFGPEGLVLATSLVNFFSAAALWEMLSRKIPDLTSRRWLLSLITISGIAIVTMNSTAACLEWIRRLVLPSTGWALELVMVIFCSCVGAAEYIVLLMVFQGHELKLLIKALMSEPS